MVEIGHFQDFISDIVRRDSMILAFDVSLLAGGQGSYDIDRVLSDLSLNSEKV